MLKWLALKLETLSYRLQLLIEVKRLKNAGRKFPKFFFLKIIFDPTRVDDFINMLCFLTNQSKVNLIDIGANIGGFTNDFLRFYPNTDEVFCFEPLHKLKEVIKKNNASHKNITIHSCALGSKTEKMNIHFPVSNTTHASFYEYNDQSSKFYNDENLVSSQVDVHRLDEFIHHFKFSSPLIIKIDTQGHEVEVIKGGMNTLKLADLVLIECSFVPEYKLLEPTFSTVCTLLAESDLYPVIFQKYSKDISFYCFERDIIFVKKELLTKIYYENY